jgi:hypothetical protein
MSSVKSLVKLLQQARLIEGYCLHALHLPLLLLLVVPGTGLA